MKNPRASDNIKKYGKTKGDSFCNNSFDDDEDIRLDDSVTVKTSIMATETEDEE